MYAKVFSLEKKKKNSLQYLGNEDIYSVDEDMVEQIWKNSKIECFTGISWEGLTCELLAKTSCHDSSHSSHVLSTWLISLDSFSRIFSRNPLSLQWDLKSSHSFSHTTLTIKSHIKYRVNMIEHNYNQIWYGIKTNTK